MTKTFAVIVLFCLVILLACTYPNKIEMMQQKDGNFILYVSDQSFEISPVDIEVFIDGKRAISENFYVGNQHNWKKFTFRLEPGEHVIKAVTIKGETAVEERFNVTDRHWAVIDYWYYPEGTKGATPTLRHLSFKIRNEPIYFK